MLMVYLSVDEIAKKHEELDKKLRAGIELDSRDLMSLFDNHSLLLRMYRQLESAFVQFHGWSPKDFGLEFAEKEVVLKKRIVKEQGPG
jgi:hypothetical protein